MPVESWYQKAAKLMVAKGLNLFAATQALDLGIRKIEAERIEDSEEFREVLHGERNRFYKALANDPARSRATAVGQLLFCIEKLIAKDGYDKAVEAIFKLARLEGWAQDQVVQNIFGDLSGDAIARLKQQYANKTAAKPN